MRTLSQLCVAYALFLTACPDGTASTDAGARDTGQQTADAAQVDGSTAGDVAATPDAGAQDDVSESGDGASTPDAATAPDAAVAQVQSCAAISEQLRAGAGATTLVSPGPAGQVLSGGNTTTLRQVVQDAQAGDSILLEDGTYTFFAADTGHGSYTGVFFTTPNVTLRSQSGNAQAVILDSGYVEHGSQSALITIDAAGVVLADLTLKRSVYHLIHFWSGADDVQVHNVRLEDGGQQFIKASGDNIDNATVSCSSFSMTASGRANVWGYGATDGWTRCYTGGIDTHNARSWHVHDNRFSGIYCDSTPHPAHGLAEDTYVGGLAEHAIHMWDAPAGGGHVVERNQIINCARGIGIGMSADVYDTVVRNNMVYSEHAGSGEHDVGINVERAHDMQIDNNTVFFSSPSAYSNAIEYRFACSGLSLRNNLTNQLIRARDGATATLSSNVTSAEAAWFVNATAGDLHLSACDISEVDGQGTALGDVTDDFDGQPRADGNDVGADQCTP